MIFPRTIILSTLAVCSLLPTSLLAQPAPSDGRTPAAPALVSRPAPAPSTGRVEIAIGAAWTGSMTFSTPDAVESNATGAAYRLFAAKSRLASALGYGARISMRVIGALQAEGSAYYGAPQLIVSVSSDVENASSVSAAERVNQIQVEGGVVLNLKGPEPGRRSVPFVTAGAGYLRELHEGRSLVATGRSYFVGAGLKQILTVRPTARLKVTGVRFDARLVSRSKGVALDDRRHLAPQVGAWFFVGF